MKILVVDDEAVIAEELCDFLSRRGHQAVMASSARTGIELLDSERFEVVLTDMRMPDGSGLDVLQAASLQAPQPLKLVMTGHATEDDLAEATRLGARRIFAKPLSLRAVIGELALVVAA